MPSPEVPQLLVHWERTVGELLDRTAHFPKAVRFTFAQRIDTLALDLLETLVRARWAYRAQTLPLLVAADGDLAVLRVMVRLSFERRYLARTGFEHLVRALDEAGRMLGGWRASLETP